MLPPAVTVTEMEPPEAAQVLALIVEGLTERWGTYDPSKNPDLASFPEHHVGSTIAVAKCGDLLVGVGILRLVDPVEAEIVRMSVVRQSRRSGIASMILEHLLAGARVRGVKAVRLETTVTWDSAVSFYEKHGFRRTQLIGCDQHFECAL